MSQIKSRVGLAPLSNKSLVGKNPHQEAPKRVTPVISINFPKHLARAMKKTRMILGELPLLHRERAREEALRLQLVKGSAMETLMMKRKMLLNSFSSMAHHPLTRFVQQKTCQSLQSPSEYCLYRFNETSLHF